MLNFASVAFLALNSILIHLFKFLLMRWKILFNGFAPRKKCNAIGAAVLEKGIDQTNAMINMGISSYLNHQSQKSLMKQNQQWQEDMYNKYQSPEALMRQYKEGGLNPFLMSGSAGQSIGQIPSSPSAPSGSTSTLPSGGSGNFAQMEYNSIISGNQRSQAVLNYIKAINDAFINGGYTAGMNMINQFLPEFKLAGMDEHTVMQLTASIRDSAACKAAIDGIEADFQKQFGRDVRETELMKLNQEISLLVGQANKMQTEAEVNRAQVKELASRTMRNFAEAYKLQKEGDKYVVDTDTAWKIQKYLIAQCILNNGVIAEGFRKAASEANIASIEEGNERAAAEMKRAISSQWWYQWMNAYLTSVGKVLSVGVNLGSSKSMIKSYGEIHSESESVSRSYVNSTSNSSSTSTNYNYNYPMGNK